MLVLVKLVRSGKATRPAAHAYLQHPEWRKYWMHLLAVADLHPPDDFAALIAVREFEERMFEVEL
jgi:hypothetical protein